MPSPSLIEAFNAAQERHSAAVADLVPLLIEVALATVTDVLPGTTVLETDGEMNEDWLFQTADPARARRGRRGALRHRHRP